MTITGTRMEEEELSGPLVKSESQKELNRCMGHRNVNSLGTVIDIQGGRSLEISPGFVMLRMSNISGKAIFATLCVWSVSSATSIMTSSAIAIRSTSTPGLSRCSRTFRLLNFCLKLSFVTFKVTYIAQIVSIGLRMEEHDGKKNGCRFTFSSAS